MKRNVWPVAVILMVTLLLPWLTVTFVPGDAGMAVCFLLFYAIDPLLAVGMGVLAALRRQWWWPVALSAAFLMGSWLIFSPGERAFLLLAGVYLALGFAAAGLAWLIRRLTKER